jgi:hypothetical protein
MARGGRLGVLALLAVVGLVVILWLAYGSGGIVGLLPPGTYDVTGKSSSGEPLCGRVRIVAGELHEVRLDPVR